MTPFTATPDCKVLIAYHGSGPVDTVSAGRYAEWLHETGNRESAAQLRATIKRAQVNKNIRAEA